MRLAVFVLQLLALASFWLAVARLLAVSKPAFRIAAVTASEPSLRLAAVVCCAAFAALALRQARIQLPFGNEKYLAARGRYDRRPRLRESRVEQGSILARDGRPLAVRVSEGGRPLRRFPLGEAAAHLVGYNSVGKGKAGLESAFHARLVEGAGDGVFGGGAAFANAWLRFIPKGLDLATGIDAQLQSHCQDAFQEASGACVVIVPDSGEILAWVSSPSFDPNRVDEEEYWKRALKDESRPLFDRAGKGLYPPGSTFKILTAAVALEDRKNLPLSCAREGFRPPGAVRGVKDYGWDKEGWRGHGPLDLAGAFELSCNNYFAQLAIRLGSAALTAGARKFHFDRDIPWNTGNESFAAEFALKRSSFKGMSDEKSNAHLSDERLAWSAIGQDKVLASPLHMALIAAAVANGGELPRPRIERARGAVMLERVMSPESAKMLARMMHGVVERGTGKNAGSQSVDIAGKTGTAEEAGGAPHSWFVGFAPSGRPKIAFAVVVERGGVGGGKAARIARSLVEKAAALGYF